MISYVAVFHSSSHPEIGNLFANGFLASYRESILLPPRILLTILTDRPKLQEKAIAQNLGGVLE
jgi:hypothetical protein